MGGIGLGSGRVFSFSWSDFGKRTVIMWEDVPVLRKDTSRSYLEVRGQDVVILLSNRSEKMFCLCRMSESVWLFKPTGQYRNNKESVQPGSPILFLQLSLRLKFYQNKFPQSSVGSSRWVSPFRCPGLSHSVVSDSLRPHRLYSPPGSSVHGILQGRILEWVAISFSRESSRLRDQTQISHIADRCFYPLRHQGNSVITQGDVNYCPYFTFLIEWAVYC